MDSKPTPLRITAGWRMRENFHERAVASAEPDRAERDRGGTAANMALIEALMGNKVEARKQANIALRYSTGRDVQYAAALALALTQNSARARSLADDLARRFPEDTLVQFMYLPTLRAQVALDTEECDASHRCAAGCRSLRFGASVHRRDPCAESLSGLHSRECILGRASRRPKRLLNSRRYWINPEPYPTSRSELLRTRPRPRLCARG